MTLFWVARDPLYRQRVRGPSAGPSEPDPQPPMTRSHQGTRQQRPPKGRATTTTTPVTRMDRSIQADAPGLQAPPPAPLPETALGAGQQPHPSLVAPAQDGMANAGADAVLDRDSSAIAAPPAVTPADQAPQAAARKVPSWLKPRGKGAAAAVAGGEVPAWMGRAGRKVRAVESPTIAPGRAVAMVAGAMAGGGRSARGGAVAAGCVAVASAMVSAGIPDTVLPRRVSEGVRVKLRWSGGTGSRASAGRAWLAKVLGEAVRLPWFVAAAVAHYGTTKRAAVRRKGKVSQ